MFVIRVMDSISTPIHLIYMSFTMLPDMLMHMDVIYYIYAIFLFFTNRFSYLGRCKFHMMIASYQNCQYQYYSHLVFPLQMIHSPTGQTNFSPKLTQKRNHFSTEKRAMMRLTQFRFIYNLYVFICAAFPISSHM